MENDIFEYAASMGCQELHLAIQEEFQLKAVIAIHDTFLGPALGGCRWIEYVSTEQALIDAIRLSQAMAYKAAISNLPLGGGKMVLLKPKLLSDKVAYFKAVGRFVDSLNGRYITAVDSGTSPNEMDIIASVTKHVTSTSKGTFSITDPSVLTAEGVEKGMEAAARFKLGKNSLQGLRISIQGLGHAGFSLAKRLQVAGAKLSVFDINPELKEKCAKELSAVAVSSLEELLKIPADIFAPCALGAVLNDQTIPLINAPIVAGCANNQLAESRHGLALMNRKILYAPDYVINSGGLIYVAAEYSRIEEKAARQQVHNIYDTLMEIFKRSETAHQPTSEIADTIAKERLKK